jgi:hypothetical protein
MSFDDLIGREGLSPEEERRLRHVHELLVAAGPPADLSPDLETPPFMRDEPKEVPVLFRRRRGLTAVLALAAALAAFAGGYAFGHGKAKPASFDSVRSVAMHGKPGVRGLIKIGASDDVGNWPMLVEVTGLPEQANRRDYYELWLTKKGKPVVSCGYFRVHGKTTRIRLTVPYPVGRFDGWIVTTQPWRTRTPGATVLTT